MSTKTVTANIKLELEIACGLSFKAWTDLARENCIVLRQPIDLDSGDYPERIYSALRRFRRVMSIAKTEPKKVVTHIHRGLIKERDDNGRPVKREYIWYSGFYEVHDYGGIKYNADLEVGKYQKPKVVQNSSRTYDQKTGEPIGSEFRFAGQETKYTIEVPKSKTERKKLIDEIIGDNFPEAIKYYYDSETSEPLGRFDDTLTYEEFVQDSIEELRKKSFTSSGGKSPGIWRDPKDGQLKDKFGQLLSNATTGKGYQ